MSIKQRFDRQKTVIITISSKKKKNRFRLNLVVTKTKANYFEFKIQIGNTDSANLASPVTILF